MAVTNANMAGADPQTICEATCWANTYTFAKFYQLQAVANSDAEFGRRVLMLAGFSAPAPHHWGGYHIPGRTTSIGRVELNSNQDASTLAVTLGATTAIAYTSVHVITIMRCNNDVITIMRCNNKYEMEYLFGSTVGIAVCG